ncbi:hypothetical protein Ppa06_57670 [Planomonospora parontospora subsp. parontospora]|uniref:RecT family protein n=2 Tax=Planomonospora parontospora TaxID=58119 RepID=A0AA37F779_9ACTN|nr:recombinase RecT [Planomonospora parontospora]GGK90681.1 hypothetical protein GCM10010126_57640 [Planomonospora parontospora]GII11969.1 hypothetical protein Ppa06_57670 [Planomonospora parontospora subsp. parontospora]
MGSELSPQQRKGLAALDETIGSYERVFREALPPGVRVERFLQDARNALAQSPELGDCYAPSVIGGLVTCAQLNIRPHIPALGHAWLLPMKNKKADYRLDATLIVGYKGFLDIGYRDPDTTMMAAHVVKVGDEFDTWFDGQWNIKYRPVSEDRDKRHTISYFAMAKFRGETFITEPMTHTQMVRHRAKYAMTRSGGPWWSNGEHSPEFDEQGKKTMIRARLIKLVPQNVQLVAATYADEGTRTDDDPNADILQVTVHPGDQAEEGADEPQEQPRSIITLLTRPEPPGEPTDQDLLVKLGETLIANGVTGPAMLTYLSTAVGRPISNPGQLTREEITTAQKAIDQRLHLDEQQPPQEADPAPEPSPAAEQPPAAEAAPTAQQSQPTAEPATDDRLRELNILFTDCGVTHHTGKGSKALNDTERFAWLERTIGARVTSTKDLTAEQTEQAIAILTDAKVGLAHRRAELTNTIGRLFAGLGITDADDQLRDVSAILGRVVATPADLTVNELADLAALLTETQGKVTAWNAAVDAAEKANRDAAQTGGTATA